MKHLLVPVDFSDASVKAAFYAGSIAEKSGGNITFLHVLPGKYTGDVQVSDSNHATSRKEKEIATALKNLATEVVGDKAADNSFTHIMQGDPKIVINDAVTRNRCDTIVMGTNGALGLKQFLRGSLTGRTMMNASVPILAVPERYVISEPKQILFATKHFEENSAITDWVFKLASLFDSNVHVISFIDTDTAGVKEYLSIGKGINRYDAWLSKRYPKIKKNVQTIEGLDFEDAITLYEVRNNIDLVTLIHYHRHSESAIAGSASRKFTHHSSVPVLIIPNYPRPSVWA